MRDYHSWFDERHGGVLAELFDEFCRVHKHPNLREPLTVALHWYRHCNTQSSGLEGSLVLGMAALELLGGLIVVERNGSMTAKKYDGLGLAEKLRKLLSALRVSTDTPQRYEALSGFAGEHSFPDACAALTELRHGFVHAKEQRRRIVFGRPAGRRPPTRGSCRSGTRNWRCSTCCGIADATETDDREMGRTGELVPWSTS